MRSRCEMKKIITWTLIFIICFTYTTAGASTAAAVDDSHAKAALMEYYIGAVEENSYSLIALTASKSRLLSDFLVVKKTTKLQQEMYADMEYICRYYSYRGTDSNMIEAYSHFMTGSAFLHNFMYYHYLTLQEASGGDRDKVQAALDKSLENARNGFEEYRQARDFLEEMDESLEKEAKETGEKKYYEVDGIEELLAKAGAARNLVKCYKGKTIKDDVLIPVRLDKDFGKLSKGASANSDPAETRYYIFDTSSHLSKYSTKNLCDGDVRTAWVEGWHGPGVGEMISIHNETRISFSTIEIMNGYGKSDNSFEGNGRVKKVRIITDNGFSQVAELKDKFKMQKIRLDQVVNSRDVYIQILETYDDAKQPYNTAIAEIILE